VYYTKHVTRCQAYSLPHREQSSALAVVKLSCCTLKEGTRKTLHLSSHTTGKSPFSLIHLLRWYNCPSRHFNGHLLDESSALSIMMSLIPSTISDVFIVLPFAVVLLLFVMIVLYQVDRQLSRPRLDLAPPLKLETTVKPQPNHCHCCYHADCE
jgi:hypothetical protein